jgi:S1-C subfamily serine protease
LLGVRFDLGESDDGSIRLAEVIEGMPAGKAGLQQGDVVTGWGDKVIGGIEDLRAELARVKPGDTVRLTVLRGKEKLHISVKFPKR